MPIRLWSTVDSQLEARPRAMTTERGGRSALAATRASSLVEALLQIADRRLQLALRPVLADCRHRPGAVADDRPEPLGVPEQRVRRDVRPDVALRGQSVALRADSLERLLPEGLLVVLAPSDPGAVLARRE